MDHITVRKTETFYPLERCRMLVIAAFQFTYILFAVCGCEKPRVSNLAESVTSAPLTVQEKLSALGVRDEDDIAELCVTFRTKDDSHDDDVYMYALPQESWASVLKHFKTCERNDELADDAVIHDIGRIHMLSHRTGKWIELSWYWRASKKPLKVYFDGIYFSESRSTWKEGDTASELYGVITQLVKESRRKKELGS